MSLSSLYLSISLPSPLLHNILFLPNNNGQGMFHLPQGFLLYTGKMIWIEPARLKRRNVRNFSLQNRWVFFKLLFRHKKYEVNMPIAKLQYIFANFSKNFCKNVNKTFGTVRWNAFRIINYKTRLLKDVKCLIIYQYSLQ